MSLENPELKEEKPIFKEGDEVKLTDKKIEQLKKGGFMAGFPQVEGVVSTVGDTMLTVEFGHSVRMVGIEDVTKIEK